MLWTQSYRIGLIGFVLSGIATIWLTAWRLRIRRYFARFGDERLAG